LKRLSKIFILIKTCLSGTFFFVVKLIMSKKQKLIVFNKVNKNTLMQHLNIEFIDIGKDFLKAKMPINSKVHQPDKVLHGGATVALAESVGSAASYIFINPITHTIRGLEISANHVRPIHIGKKTHLWEIKVIDENDMLISHCKLTNIVIEKK
jgi:1,4-dihydroxy-2-naphthoyl-CoA hydrolase